MKDTIEYYLKQHELEFMRDEQRQEEEEVIRESWKAYYGINLIDKLTPEEISEAFSETEHMLEFKNALMDGNVNRTKAVARAIIYDYWFELKVDEAVSDEIPED